MLAVSLPVTALYANPREINNPAAAAARLRACCRSSTATG